jgi:hypothetical protein
VHTAKAMTMMIKPRDIFLRWVSRMCLECRNGYTTIVNSGSCQRPEKNNKEMSCTPQSPILGQCPLYWTTHTSLGTWQIQKLLKKKALEPLKSCHFCISNFRTCWFSNETWVVQD